MERNIENKIDTKLDRESGEVKIVREKRDDRGEKTGEGKWKR